MFTNVVGSGDASPSNLKTRPGEEGVSFWDSLVNPNARPQFAAKKKYIGVVSRLLPPESIRPDGFPFGFRPPGHFTVVATVEILKDVYVAGGKIHGSWPPLPKA